MRFTTRASSRALITVAATGAAMSIGLLACTAPAWAHVRVTADNPTPGSNSVLTFKVPNESEKGALTTQLSVAPEIALTGAKAVAADDHPMPVAQSAVPDNSARWLAGGALAVAAVAVATALLIRRQA